VAAGLGMGLMLLRAAHDIFSGLTAEFGRRAAGWCSLPMGVIAALLLGRALAALAGAGSSGQPLDTGEALQVGMALAVVLMAMTMHLAMGGMLMLRMIERLRHLSQHDALTGLLNRRAFGQRLDAERARRQRQPAPMALLALDLDHFKAVNDRWGHAAGDAVLVAAAALLQREARSVDAVARMGGEEFALLLPGTDLDGAHRLAERVLDAFRDMVVVFEGEPLRVTASIGSAVATDPAEATDELLKRADRALYLAKAGGRDRVVCAGALSAVEPPSSPSSGASTAVSTPPRRVA
jgi:diguanylate cyclase (GGDEF)-like protein